MKVPAAWKLLLESGVSKIPTKIVGLLDDCRPSAVPNRDLVGRVDVRGFDAERNFSRSFGIGIGGDHAAIMASVIAGSTNTFGTVGVNPGVVIHTVACGQDRFVRESSLMRGIEHCASVDIKLICIGANPGFRSGAINPNALTLTQINKYRNRPGSYPIRGLSNQYLVPSLGAYLESYRKYYDGLAFLSAGNDGRSTTRTGDFSKGAVTIGALSADGTKMAPFSNLGSFFAPGQNIYATNASGRVVSVSGTSVAAANATGVASLMSATGLYQQAYIISALMGNSAMNSPVGCIDALESLRAARDPNISSN